MKTCADRRADLADLVFGDLDDASEIDLNQHLLTCAECCKEERRLLSLRDAARDLDPAPSAELRARVRASVERETSRHTVGLLRRPVPGYVALAAGMIGALVVALLPVRLTGRVGGAPSVRPVF